ncbi:MAG: glycosyltransferase family 2 protein [bacterium]
MTKISFPDPLVSIIIPTYNRADLIRETLDTVRKQSYKHWECIVVDDGSSDGTKDVLNKFVQEDNRFKYVLRPDNHLPGGNGARNHGFDISQGELIQWFDSDDLMYEHFLSAKVEQFQKYPDCQSIISRFTFFEKNKVTEKQYHFWNRYPNLYENTITVKIPVWTPCIIFKKSFLLETGERLDETLKRLQEYEFFTRIFVRHPHETKLLDKSLCMVRKHAQTKTSDFNDRQTFEMYESFYEANHRIVSVLLEQSKMTSNLEDYFYKDHKRYITISQGLGYHELSVKFKALAETYLKSNKSYFRLLRFRVGYFFYKRIPVSNFFLVFEMNNKVIKGSVRNFRRVVKLLSRKDYMNYAINKLKNNTDE